MEVLALDLMEQPPPQIDEALFPVRRFEEPRPIIKAKQSTLFERPADLESYGVACLDNTSSLHVINWRWIRAWFQFENRLPVHRDYYDPIVEQIVECLAVEASDPTTPFMSHLHQAYHLYREGTFQTAELEARLLSGQSAEEIAGRLSIPAAVIDHYHDTFFEVRRMLACSSFIMSAVFSTEIHTKGIQDFRVFLRLMAFQGGPSVLDEVLLYHRSPRPTLPRKLKNVSTDQLLHARRWLTVHQAVLAYSIVPTNDRERLRTSQMPTML